MVTWPGLVGRQVALAVSILSACLLITPPTRHTSLSDVRASTDVTAGSWCEQCAPVHHPHRCWFFVLPSQEVGGGRVWGLWLGRTVTWKWGWGKRRWRECFVHHCRYVMSCHSERDAVVTSAANCFRLTVHRGQCWCTVAHLSNTSWGDVKGSLLVGLAPYLSY